MCIRDSLRLCCSCIPSSLHIHPLVSLPSSIAIFIVPPSSVLHHPRTCEAEVVLTLWIMPPLSASRTQLGAKDGHAVEPVDADAAQLVWIVGNAGPARDLRRGGTITGHADQSGIPRIILAMRIAEVVAPASRVALDDHLRV